MTSCENVILTFPTPDKILSALGSIPLNSKAKFFGLNWNCYIQSDPRKCYLNLKTLKFNFKDLNKGPSLVFECFEFLK